MQKLTGHAFYSYTHSHTYVHMYVRAKDITRSFNGTTKQVIHKSQGQTELHATLYIFSAKCISAGEIQTDLFEGLFVTGFSTGGYTY